MRAFVQRISRTPNHCPIWHFRRGLVIFHHPIIREKKMNNDHEEERERAFIAKLSETVPEHFAQYVWNRGRQLYSHCRPGDPRYDEYAQKAVLDIIAAAVETDLDRAAVSAILEDVFGRHVDITEAWSTYRRQVDEKVRSAIQEKYFRPLDGRAASGGELLRAHTGPPPAQWGQGLDVLWATGEPLMIESGYGCGKTTLAGLLVRAQLFGGGVLGHPVKRLADGQRVLYLAIDRPDQIMRSMGRQFSPSQLDEIGDRLVVWQGQLPDDAAENERLFVDLCDYHRATVVFVDSLKDAARGLTEDRAAAAYQATRNRLLTTGRQLVELHHLAKSGSDYGSVWLRAGAGSVLRLSGRPGGIDGQLTHDKSPAHRVGPIKIKHDRDAGEILAVDGSKPDLAEWVAGHGEAGVTLAGAAEFLFGKNAGRADKDRARYALAKLTTDGGPLRENKSIGQPTTWSTYPS